MAEITYKIKSNIGIISSNKGWTKELNLISWNGKEAKFDLRNWAENHTKMSKGITMTKSELINLKELLNIIKINEVFGIDKYDDIADEDLLDEV